MGGGGGSTTKPSPENRFATGVGLGYLLGPQDLGDSKATEGAALFGGAGQGVGILPDWGNVMDTSRGTYYDYLNSPGASPILTNALGGVMNPPSINIDMSGFGDIGGGFGGGGFGGGAGGMGGSMGGNIIPKAYQQQALDYLSNTPSPFDKMSGGPIVDTINQRVAAEDTAYTDKAMADMAKAQEQSYANAQVTGDLISSEQVMQHRDNIARDVLMDLNTLRATRSLESTKYLGDLAMQDIANQSNNMQEILKDALTEYGIDKEAATALSINASNNAKDLAIAKLNSMTDLSIAKLNSATDLSMNTQNRMSDLVQSGLTDYQTSKDRELNTMLYPVQAAIGIGNAGGGSISRTPKSP